MNNPKISVIIPSYNRKSLLCECVDSVLAQTYENKEIIIVDDCSTDGTGDNLRTIYGDKVRYYKNERNMGCYYSRRFGFDKAQGELAVFMDDDDYYIDCDFFKKAVKAYINNPSVSVIGACSTIQLQDSSKTAAHDLSYEGFIAASEYLKNIRIKYGKPDAFATVYVREKIKEHVHDMSAVNDTPLCMRALLSGDAYLMSDVVGTYRKHESNISNGISSEFLIENLSEKKRVAELAAQKGLLDDADEWLHTQTRLTVRYYSVVKNRRRREAKKLFDWMEQNVSREAAAELRGEYRKKLLQIPIKAFKKVLGK